MNYKEMLPLMGQVVTVKAELRYYGGQYIETANHRDWVTRECLSWAGWIVGFRYKLSGRVEIDYDTGNTFHESSRQLCVMVSPWPTVNAKPVPLDGYELGGTPAPPDNGGWAQRKRALTHGAIG